jgi:hypothetical protein
MPAPKGNQYWKLAHNWHKPKKYTPKKLLELAFEYIEWAEKNPLYEMKAFSSQGKILKTKLPKMRALTIQGFCWFANMEPLTFRNYEKDKAYVTIITRIREMFFSQKLEGAAAEMLNPNIIARELRLGDSTELTGKDGKPLFPELDLSKLSVDELKQYRSLLLKAKKDESVQ